MAKTVRYSILDTRSARSRLKQSGKPYYRAIDTGLHLGYRKGRTGGKWVARWYVGNQAYRIETIGTADDIIDADGIQILNFSQAQAAARRLFIDRKRELTGMPSLSAGPYTVRSCLTDYIDWMEAHRKSASDARYKANAIIIPALGDIECSRLTAAQINKWLDEVAKAAPRLRTSPGKVQRVRPSPKDDEGRRQRRATANRIFTILRAALNRGWQDGKIASDDAWRRVKPFKDADAARVRYLTMAEVKRLTNACPPDFRALVQTALVTGARYGELATLNVGDFNPDSGTLHIRRSKSGKDRHVALAREGRTLVSKLAAGRTADEPMLRKTDGSRWGASHQARPMIEGCMAAGIRPPVSFHCLRHTYASHAIMGGAALIVVAKSLGHADTRMVEKHYGNLAPSYVADAIRAALPKFGFKLDRGAAAAARR